MEKVDLLGSEEEKKEEGTGTSLFHHLMAQREQLFEDPLVAELLVTLQDVSVFVSPQKIVLQRLVVAARLPGDAAAAAAAAAADGTDVGAHHEDLIFRLRKQHIRENVTGLLVAYPSCLLQVVESTREILISVLEDVAMLQRDRALLDAKIVFMAHNPRNRLFQQWSCKVLDAGQVAGGAEGQSHKVEEEEDTETLVCGVLSVLQKLSAELEISKTPLPGLVLDQSPTLIVPQKILEKLLDRDELQSPSEYLQTYASPLNVNIEFGHGSS